MPEISFANTLNSITSPSRVQHRKRDLVESPAGGFLIACAEKALADKVWTDKRFSGTRRSDFRPYLEEDLRIDLALLAALDRSRFPRIQQAYGSRKIGNLFRFLDALAEPPPCMTRSAVC